MGRKKGLFPQRVDVKIAQVLTTLFSPAVAALIGVSILYFRYIYPQYGPSYGWLLVVALILAASIGTVYYFLISGRVSNWDISDRRQRPKVLLLLNVYEMILMVATWGLGIYEALPFLILFSLSLFLASLITLYWKVSFHTFAITLTVLFVLFTYRKAGLLVLVPLPFIIAWTRVILKKHTKAQAVGGIVLALFVASTWALYRMLKEIIAIILK